MQHHKTAIRLHPDVHALEIYVGDYIRPSRDCLQGLFAVGGALYPEAVHPVTLRDQRDLIRQKELELILSLPFSILNDRRMNEIPQGFINSINFVYTLAKGSKEHLVVLSHVHIR
jgi:hypothetical protein